MGLNKSFAIYVQISLTQNLFYKNFDLEKIVKGSVA